MTTPFTRYAKAMARAMYQPTTAQQDAAKAKAKAALDKALQKQPSRKRKWL